VARDQQDVGALESHGARTVPGCRSRVMAWLQGFHEAVPRPTGRGRRRVCARAVGLGADRAWAPQLVARRNDDVRLCPHRVSPRPPRQWHRAGAGKGMWSTSRRSGHYRVVGRREHGAPAWSWRRGEAMGHPLPEVAQPGRGSCPEVQSLARLAGVQCPRGPSGAKFAIPLATPADRWAGQPDR
jgi:hypothetical protein